MKKRVAVNKLAVSPIIAFVLLLGLSVSIAIMVYVFSVRQVETLSEKGVSFVNAGMGCENVYLSVNSENGCSEVTVFNNGLFDINGLVVRSFSPFGAKSVVDEILVDVKKSASLSFGLVNADKLEVVPLLKVSDELVGCKGRMVSVSCEGLTDLQKFTCEQADPDSCDRLAETGIVTCEECHTINLCYNC